MKTITVSASRNYDITIGTDLLRNLGDVAAKLCKGKNAVIVSDSNVWPIYGQTVSASLEKAGFETGHFVFPAGEASKCPKVYLEILTYLADRHMTRSDIVIALGGGVVGDITGFSAATFLRGIPYIQIPTSLLAMVDSSVGGKTAIDLPNGKNLVGAFYQPSAVLCDIDTLSSLPDSIFRDGCAEIIKYGILYDPALVQHLEDRGLNFDRELVISTCVKLKSDVVNEDEFDTGARQKLNLGHTLGHGVEAGSHFSVSHGQAVAIGTALVARACCKNGICSQSLCDRIVTLIQKFRLPTETDFTAEVLYEYALSDKKRFGGTVNLILPRHIGDCCISPTPVQELLSFIKAGLL